MKTAKRQFDLDAEAIRDKLAAQRAAREAAAAIAINKIAEPAATRWLDDVRAIVAKLPARFVLSDVYAARAFLALLHSGNADVHAMVRHCLQQLRDAGELRFLGAGSYQKVTP